MAQLELSPVDLQNIVALCEMGIKAEGRKVIPVLEPLAQKVEQYLATLAKEQQESQGKAEEAPATQE